MSRRRSRAHGSPPVSDPQAPTETEPAAKQPVEPAGLTSDEAELWGHVAKSVQRIAPKGRAMRSTAQAAPAVLRPGAADGPAAEHPSADVPGTGAKPRRHSIGAARGAAPPPSAELPPFDRRKARHIAKGRVEIDARLDLHGMTQERAHGALRHFLQACHQRGCRTVLVITGKGGQTGGGFHDHADRSERGILRRNVPRWLAEPDMAPLVVSFTAAAQRHGGDGALYIHMRSRRSG